MYLIEPEPTLGAPAAWGAVMRLPLAHSPTAVLSRVRKTENAPFRYICRIQVNIGRSDSEIATGFLVGPRHVLTAAHPLVDRSSLVAPGRVTVSPATDGPDAPFGNSDVASIFTRSGFTPGDEVTVDDLALLKTTEDFARSSGPAFPVPGFWGTPRHAEDDRGSVVGAIPGWPPGHFKVNVGGYPLSRGGDTQWHCYDDSIKLSAAVAAKLSAAERRRFLFVRNAIEPGMSGAPLWVTRHRGLGGRFAFAVVLGMKEIDGKRYATGRLVDGSIRRWIRRKTGRALRWR